MNEETLIERLRKRAEIRRQIPTRKSVQNNESDRIADLLEEASTMLQEIKNLCNASNSEILLSCGEMSAQELRTLKSYLSMINRKLDKGE